MTYALTTIWHERNRFLPAILAVAFSAVLIALQSGLLLGLLSMMSTPVDKANADIWLTYPGVRSVDLGWGIPHYWQSHVERQPEVERVESCVMGFGMWKRLPTSAKKDTVTEVCMIIGTKLDRDALGLPEQLRNQAALAARLMEPMTVLIDESDRDRLGISRTDENADIMGLTVRVVGFTRGLRSLGGPYVFCSQYTAATLLRMMPDDLTFILAKCRSPEAAKRVAVRLRESNLRMEVYTRDEFSFRTRLHWMTTTKAGLALAFTACLGLIVGGVVTSQTLYAATVAAQREYATLRAMGIPRWRLKMSVLAQSFWVGLGGILVAVPITLALGWFANFIGTQVRLPWFVAAPAAAVTMVMALGSGLFALRSLQKVDPVQNIR